MSNVKNSEKLDSLLQFDAGRKPSITQTVFDKALEKINEKREEEALEAATTLLEQAMALKVEHSKRRREFESASQKFEKELGKVIGRLASFIPGGPPTVPNDSDDSSESGTSGEPESGTSGEPESGSESSSE